jgi:sigma-E factor negative regulatory protein RseC
MGESLIKTGVVKAVRGNMAVVVTRHESECESCSARDTCATLGGSGANREVMARNTARAQVGDVVKISIGGSAFLKVTFLVYMVPILALIGGALLGYFLSAVLTGNKDLFVGIFGGLAFVASFLWLRKKGDKLSQNKEYVPEIISRQSPTKAMPSADASCPIH